MIQIDHQLQIYIYTLFVSAEGRIINNFTVKQSLMLMCSWINNCDLESESLNLSNPITTLIKAYLSASLHHKGKTENPKNNSVMYVKEKSFLINFSL